jgi:hypothetical protein
MAGIVPNLDINIFPFIFKYLNKLCGLDLEIAAGGFRKNLQSAAANTSALAARRNWFAALSTGTPLTL